jgi:hypothetical protein
MTKPDPLKVTNDVGVEPAPAADPFDLSKLRLDQDFVESVGFKQLLKTVPVPKPHRQEYVHPAPEYRIAAALKPIDSEPEAGIANMFQP